MSSKSPSDPPPPPSPPSTTTAGATVSGPSGPSAANALTSSTTVPPLVVTEFYECDDIWDWEADDTNKEPSFELYTEQFPIDSIDLSDFDFDKEPNPSTEIVQEPGNVDKGKQPVQNNDGDDDGYSREQMEAGPVDFDANPTRYYKCKNESCLMKKMRETSSNDQFTRILYTGKHDHPKPWSPNGGSSSSNPVLDDDPDQQAKRLKTQGDRKEDNKCSVQVKSDIDILEDGYKWYLIRKSVTKDNPNLKSYFCCKTKGCPVKKHVVRAADDIKSVITTYVWKHNHPLPDSRPQAPQPANVTTNPVTPVHVSTMPYMPPIYLPQYHSNNMIIGPNLPMYPQFRPLGLLPGQAGSTHQMGQGGFINWQGMLGPGGYTYGMHPWGYMHGPSQGVFQQGPGRGGFQHGPGQGGFQHGPGQGGLQHGPGQGGLQHGPGQGGLQHGPRQGGLLHGPGQGGFQHGPGQGGYIYAPAQGGYIHAPAQGGYIHERGRGVSIHGPSQGALIRGPDRGGLHRLSLGSFTHGPSRGGPTLGTGRGGFTHGPSQGGSTHGAGRGDFAHGTGREGFIHGPDQGGATHGSGQGGSTHGSGQGGSGIQGPDMNQQQMFPEDKDGTQK